MPVASDQKGGDVGYTAAQAVAATLLASGMGSTLPLAGNAARQTCNGGRLASWQKVPR
jgi:hypothetical protein